MGYNDTLAKNQIRASGKKQSSRQDQYLCIVYLLSFLIVYNVLSQVDFSQREGIEKWSWGKSAVLSKPVSAELENLGPYENIKI